MINKCWVQSSSSQSRDDTVDNSQAAEYMNSEIYEVFVQSQTHGVFQNQTLISLKKESGPFTLISHLFSQTQTQQKLSQSHTLLFISFSFITRTLATHQRRKRKEDTKDTITSNCLVWPLFTYFLIIFCSLFYILFVNAKAENGISGILC